MTRQRETISVPKFTILPMTHLMLHPRDTWHNIHHEPYWFCHLFWYISHRDSVVILQILWILFVWYCRYCRHWRYCRNTSTSHLLFLCNALKQYSRTWPALHQPHSRLSWPRYENVNHLSILCPNINLSARKMGQMCAHYVRERGERWDKSKNPSLSIHFIGWNLRNGPWPPLIQSLSVNRC